MTKKNLIKRSFEFKEYEEQMLLYVKEKFSKYKNLLSNLGLALDIDLSWYNQQENEDLSFSRIDFKDGYICNIDITIRRKEEPEHDLDLFCLNFIHPILRIGQTILRWLFGLGICCSKVPPKQLKEFLDNTEGWIKKVLDKGYEAVLEEVKELDK